MTNEDKKQFAEIMTTMYEMYNQQANKEVFRMYWGILKDYSIQQIQQAISDHISNTKTGQFRPKPADILKFINGGKSSIEIKNQQAGIKWLAKKKEEEKAGILQFTQEEITRIEMGVV